MFMKMLTPVLTLTLLLFVGVVHAAPLSQTLPYYGQEFFADLQAGVTNEALAQRIKKVLRSYHQTQENGFDQIVDNCSAGAGTCYMHHAIGYDAARVWLMGGYYLKQDPSNGYAVWDVYCNEYRGQNDFGGNAGPAPGVVPGSTVINTEHTWPQSLFSRNFPNEDQKSDLHHLFPTDSKLNALRSSYWFGEVQKETRFISDCPQSGSHFGVGVDGSQVFEPPMDHKGHVARALLYFSIRYDSKIDPQEEAILKRWNHEHPVDEDEARRNDEIFKAQGNRNPFVDYPELADLISDF